MGKRGDWEREKKKVIAGSKKKIKGKKLTKRKKWGIKQGQSAITKEKIEDKKNKGIN